MTHLDCSATKGTGEACHVTASYLSDDGSPLCGWHRGKATRQLVQAEKRCSACRIVKPLTAFHRGDTGLFGRHTQCKPCINRYKKPGRVSSDVPRSSWGCNMCRSNTHTSAECPHRNKDSKICPVCSNLPHRVPGLRCVCGLRRASEPALHAVDFGGTRGSGPTFPEGGPGWESDNAGRTTADPESRVFVKGLTHSNEVRALETNVVNPFFKDETGHKYGRFVVIGRVPNVGGQARWRLRCEDCGLEIRVTGHSLRHSARVRGGPNCPQCAKTRKGRRTA